MALTGVLKPIHIITFQHREYDRETTPWEIARMKRLGYYKLLGGIETFDFREGEYFQHPEDK